MRTHLERQSTARIEDTVGLLEISFDYLHEYMLHCLSCIGGERSADCTGKRRCGREFLVLIWVQDQMDVDGAAGSAAAGPLKADSVAVLLGQALQAQDKALLEKCGPVLILSDVQVACTGSFQHSIVMALSQSSRQHRQLL